MYPNVNGDTLVSPVIASNTVHTAAMNPSFLSLPLVDGFPSLKNNTPDKSAMQIYPQPANDLMQISLPADIVLPANIELYLPNGQLVKQDICSGTLWSIDVSINASGVYILKINTSNTCSPRSKSLYVLPTEQELIPEY